MSTNEQNLGHLERVELNAVWTSEASGFTPWLAREDNISRLGDAIGLELQVEAVERSVGLFRVDILCRDTINDNYVLIENQLQRTDHTHLGQLLTYAAGLDAVTIVWIAKRFSEEHRAALDWLNRITSESFNFFGLEVELWRIEESPVAPKFNVVSRPNERTKRSTEKAIRHPERHEYWVAFHDFLAEHAPDLKPGRATDGASLDISVGWKHVLFKVGTYDDHIFVRLAVAHNAGIPLGDIVLKDKEAIEREFGGSVVGKGKMGRPNLVARRDGGRSAPGKWEEDFHWYVETIRKLKTIMEPRCFARNPCRNGDVLGRQAIHTVAGTCPSAGPHETVRRHCNWKTSL